MMSGFATPLFSEGGDKPLQKHVQLLYLKKYKSKLALIYSNPFVSIYGNIQPQENILSTPYRID